MAQIIEATCDKNMDRIVTVQTDRGDEYSLNVDALAMGFADLLSEREYEARQGWMLERAWFVDGIDSLKRAAVVT